MIHALEGFVNKFFKKFQGNVIESYFPAYFIAKPINPKV